MEENEKLSKADTANENLIPSSEGADESNNEAAAENGTDAADKPASAVPTITRITDSGNGGADVGLFIDELKKDRLFPEEIERALEEARQRIHVEIPDPPADLWDPDLDELSELALPGKRRHTILQGKTAADEAELDLFADRHSQAPELLELDGFDAAKSGTAAAIGATENQTQDSPQTEAKGDVDDADSETLAPAHTADEAAAETQDTDHKAAAVNAKETPNPPRGAKAKAKKESGGEAAEIKQSRFNPWNLIFGRNNLVDASATLIFMHAGLLFALELLWKQLPVLLPNFNKNSFAAFVWATAAIQGLTLLFPMFLCFNLYRIPSGTILGKVKIGRALALSSLLMGLPAALFFNGINNIFTNLMINWDVVLPAYVLPTWASASSKPGLILMILVGAFLPSILEELFFRGFLQKAFYGLKRKRSAIILSALAFAFFHNDPLFVIAPFGAGILLGYLRKNSESIIPAILTHFSMNCASFFLDPILPRFNTQMVLLFPEEGMSTLLANVVATVASGVVLFFIYRFINTNLVRTRSYAGFMTGRRAVVYGRNQTQKARVLDSPDRLYLAPALTWGNYIRLFLALLVWVFSRFLIK